MRKILMPLVGTEPLLSLAYLFTDFRSWLHGVKDMDCENLSWE